jgi:glutamate-1-semialdehyde 2,1-aminomutase
MSAIANQNSLDNNFYGALKSRRQAIVADYLRQTPVSAERFARAKRTFPGGFTRDAILRAPYAPFIERAEGSTMIDADQRRIIDLWFNATALPLGHAHPLVVEAGLGQLPLGTAYFAPTTKELALGELLVGRIPCAERIRFANSGSEAVMMALRFARAFTGRPLIAKFEGSYHGAYDDVSWSVAPTAAMGPADAPYAVADTAGLVSPDSRVLMLPFNDTVALERMVEARHADIAVILVEPLANRMGLLMPQPGFLATARRLCDRYGIVLLFDEVIAFRWGYHGAQGEVGVTPDLVTLGKVIGGGFPVGAIAGKAEILERSAPEATGRVTHAGTFNGNPMVGACGLATMQLLTMDAFAAMNAMGGRVRQRIAQLVEGLPLQVTGAGSLFKITATGRTLAGYRDAMTSDKAWEQTASLALLNAGYMLTPNLAGCVSTVTSEAEIEGFLGAFAELLA